MLTHVFITEKININRPKTMKPGHAPVEHTIKGPNAEI